ncbi:MAG: hypothetical protein U1G08_18850 [Verrucomicrobiota bacterium]
MTQTQLHALASDVRQTADRLATLTLAASVAQHPDEWRECHEDELADALSSLEASGLLAGRLRRESGHPGASPDPSQAGTPPGL